MKRKLLILLLSISGLTAQATTQNDSTDFVPDGVFHATIEGPATDKDGNLYAVNYGVEGTIGKVSPKGEVSLALTLPKGSIGNGIRFDQQGQMFIADYTGHNIWRYDGKKLELHAHQPLMFQPNDLTIAANGVIFASDPDWKNNKGQLWRIDTDGSSRLVEKDMGTTNGVEISPDQRRLYVNESAQRRIWVYDLDEQLNASNKRLLIQFPDFGLDGMRTDAKGNLYIARYGKAVVAKVSPEGKLLQEYKLKGEFPTNVTFSQKDPTLLYVTLQKRGAVELIKL
ncbi:SMP-30/gluconolactonase/LRE family protein [Rheinheimera sp.]|jgi:sugar lactone lactonase YvrE|uniref:SMP-30/gluconolactonase/LRE family protein n=1 Tax=Rheinheimera sp. TaxID=1869214 RepID=UPI002633A228|nr:SMP-30/gluconolactonase/LRE family protein [Rheinheimera sp.]MCA1930416.1 SMP-30/gluconolactonase/LRE family protein [Rheinheimera sp.]